MNKNRVLVKLVSLKAIATDIGTIMGLAVPPHAHPDRSYDEDVPLEVRKSGLRVLRRFFQSFFVGAANRYKPAEFLTLLGSHPNG